MSRLIAYEFLSLDGRFSGPDGSEMDWVRRHFTRRIEEDIAEQYTRVEAFLMGRRTFDGLAGYWPTPAAADEHLVGQMNSLPKLVVSHRPDVAAWPNSEHLGADPLGEVQRRLSRGNGDIMIIGSGDIVRQMARASLLDELRLLVFPETVPRGRQLFDSSWHPARWERTRCHAFDGGAVALHYRAPDAGWRVLPIPATPWSSGSCGDRGFWGAEGEVLRSAGPGGRQHHRCRSRGRCEPQYGVRVGS